MAVSSQPPPLREVIPSPLIRLRVLLALCLMVPLMSVQGMLPKQGFDLSGINFTGIPHFIEPDSPSMAGHALRIFIDPGHGGNSLGTLGHYGAPEKVIALQMAQLLAGSLTTESYLRHIPLIVKLSREADVFIPLRARAHMAESWGADLMISVHANAAANTSVEGLETYVGKQLAHSPSLLDTLTPEMAQVIQRENESTRGSAPTSPKALAILQSTQNHWVLSESLALAQALLSSAQSQVRVRGVHMAPFTVLTEVPIPSVLIEVGYLSHPQEEERLNNSVYQEHLASALASGILALLAKRFHTSG